MADRPTLNYERKLREKGAVNIAGLDEAGRGALAGPVVAAAVVLPPGMVIDGVNDSKKLTGKTRESLYERILESASAVGVGVTDRELIDATDILKATKMAMTSAIFDLPLSPDALLIDFVTLPHVDIRQESIVKGDNLSQSIAAASIIAKVTRDEIMRYFHEIFPCYRFDRHKGYATRSHLESVREHGPCRQHRISFRGVKEHIYRVD